MIIVYILFALFLLWLFLIMPRLNRPAALSALHRHRYAHRGLHNIKKSVPENSMLAFRLAKEAGYGIELDVHLSKDGKLVVEHDDTLRRTCNSELIIEKTDWETLSTLHLEGTEERLPLLEEVFSLIDGKVPLLIELKAVGGNWNALAQAVSETLKGYNGPYCIESFEPRALLWLRKNAPHIVRGQLAGHVRKNGNVSPVINFALKNLLVNVLSRPDFVAYQYKDYKNLSFRLCKTLFRPPLFFWTVRSDEGMALSERFDAAPIFEKID
ncbi:MAG: glycerophosphodiester phosphodiesterase [Clostridia bacterium]|nr:glycerophosphodiester phosphodiesterase [Clostridia bacterium]